jgi:hypothetical protein
MVYCDRRLLGVERWYQGCLPEDFGMRVSDGVVRSVCFVSYYDRRAGGVMPGGTGFLVSWSGSGWPEFYVVTARHCVSEARKGDGHVYITVNRKRGGIRDLRIANDKWSFLGDEGIDLAVAPFDSEDDDAVSFIPRESLVTAARIERHQIGLGDDVWLPGLFRGVPGGEANRPILRMGTIAATPSEPIATLDTSNKPRTPFSAYLIEVRSHSGLSGSPVWVHLPYGRGHGHLDEPPQPSAILRQIRHVSSVMGGTPPDDAQSYLLGVLRMHWPASVPKKTAPETRGKKRRPVGSEAESTPFFRDFSDNPDIVNTGIAAVVPITELVTLLERDDLVRERMKKHPVYSRQSGSVSVEDFDASRSPDTPGPEPERLQIDDSFEGAVGKMLKSGKPKPPAASKRKRKR